MADIKQQELDFIEQQVLTDIFGGYTQDKFVYKYGLFKIDLSQKVQFFINKFESLIKPIMDENGFIDTNMLKKYINEDIIKLPDGKYRCIELYRKYQPYISTFLK